MSLSLSLNKNVDTADGMMMLCRDYFIPDSYGVLPCTNLASWAVKEGVRPKFLIGIQETKVGTYRQILEGFSHVSILSHNGAKVS